MRLTDGNLASYLHARELIGSPEGVVVEPAGDGNINYVRRARDASGKSVVVKQARAELERFPEYRTSPERMVCEYRYGTVARERVPAACAVLPAVLHFDPQAFVMVMEDLGDAPRLDHEFAAGRANAACLRTLGEFAGAVHAATSADSETLSDLFQNLEIQTLHGEHIFSLPFEPNEFGVAEDVLALAERELARDGVRETVAALRERYYGEREALCHGDIQFGNVLLQGDTPRLLDAEIAHVGDPAFDLGIALAHIELHTALAPASAVFAAARDALIEGYVRGSGCDDARIRRALQFAGVEVLRRTLGASRLALVESLETAALALRRGADLVLGVSI